MRRYSSEMAQPVYEKGDQLTDRRVSKANRVNDSAIRLPRLNNRRPRTRTGNNWAGMGTTLACACPGACEPRLSVGHRAVFVEGCVEDLVDKRMRGQRVFVQFDAQARAVRHDQKPVFQLDGLNQ